MTRFYCQSAIRALRVAGNKWYWMLNAIVVCILNNITIKLQQILLRMSFTFPINWRGFLVFFLVEKI